MTVRFQIGTKVTLDTKGNSYVTLVAGGVKKELEPAPLPASPSEDDAWAAYFEALNDFIVGAAVVEWRLFPKLETYDEGFRVYSRLSIIEREKEEQANDKP